MRLKNENLNSGQQVIEILSKIDPKKKGMLSSIPSNMLKFSKHFLAGDLCTIWNKEINTHGYFSNRLKLADITPIHKKLEKNFRENYRNMSILPAVSKVTNMFCASFRD